MIVLNWIKNNLWIAIVVPVLGFLAYVFGLQQKNTELKQQVATDSVEKGLAQAVSNMDQAGKVADDKEADFKRALDEFNKSSK